MKRDEGSGAELRSAGRKGTRGSDRAFPVAGTDEPVTLETGLEALQSSSEFRGPVESLDGHRCNDHFAHIYETAEEKFAADVPFIRHGLERGERVMYVVDESTEAEVTAALGDAGVDVTVDCTVEADGTYVRHLFRNLLENAVEHGGSDVAITVGDLPGGFYVADDGPGIPPEERETVFDEGYTTTAESGGSGLGLAFVRKLAEVYGWEYAVTDSEDGGARFEFRVDDL